VLTDSWQPKIGLFVAAFVAASAPIAALADDAILLRAREGAAALMRGQYDKAIALYDDALGAPEIADFVEASIYSDRGVAKWRLKRTKEAVEDFNKSIQLSPENAVVYNNRGNALVDLGHPEEAIKDFDRAIALSPNYGAAYNNRGNARMALRRYNLAFQDFRKAVELMPQSAVPFNGRGTAHADLKRYHAAVRDLSRAISLDPKYVAAYRHRANAYLALGNYRDAVADASQVLTLEPDAPNSDMLFVRARAYTGDKKLNFALDDLNKVLEAEPNLVDAYIERAVVFIGANRYDDAIGDLNRAIFIDPRNARAYAMRASAKLKTEANVDALNDVNQALQLADNDPFALRVRGNVYEALERPDEAIADYRVALAKDPFQTESREALQRLDQEVPAEEGRIIGQEVEGWVIKEPQPGRYIAINDQYPALRVDLEMFGTGKPKILEWKLLKNALKGIGLLKYYAGDFGDGTSTDLEYVAIVDTYAKKVVAVEPHSWGEATAQWNWQAVSVVVTDPDGNANEIKLRTLRKPTPVARSADSDRRRGGPRGEGTGGIFNWLFR
jgi:tetratricopeptide (TPR) repeat protein